MKKNQFTIAFAFETLMAIFYIAFAYVLIFTTIFDQIIGESFKLPLGFILTFYGIFRVYRVYRKTKADQKNENN